MIINTKEKLFFCRRKLKTSHIHKGHDIIEEIVDNSTVPEEMTDLFNFWLTILTLRTDIVIKMTDNGIRLQWISDNLKLQPFYGIFMFYRGRKLSIFSPKILWKTFVQLCMPFIFTYIVFIIQIFWQHYHFVVFTAPFLDGQCSVNNKGF